MMKTLVLGIGNQLMKDDGIGMYVVEALQMHHTKGQICYIVGETDIDYCLQVIDEFDVLIIVDAVIMGKVAGEVMIFPLEEFKALDSPGISAHNLHLFQMIPIVYPNVLGFVIGIEVDSIGFGMELSGELHKQFFNIVTNVSSSIDECVHISGLLALFQKDL